MRLLTIETSLYEHKFGKIEQNHIGTSTLDSVNVENNNGNCSRGVLVHQIDEEINYITIKEKKQVTKQTITFHEIKREYNWFQNLLIYFCFMSKDYTEEIIEHIEEHEIDVLKKESVFTNRVLMLPENDFHDGFIIDFKPSCYWNNSVIIQFESTDEEVVVSSHTNYSKFDSVFKKNYTGTLVVIHGSENKTLELNYYSATKNNKEKLTSITYDTFQLVPEDLNTEKIKYNVLFKAKSSDIEHFKISTKYFNYLMEQFENSIQQVYEIIQDPELNTMNLEIFLTMNRLSAFDKKLSYTKSSVI